MTNATLYGGFGTSTSGNTLTVDGAKSITAKNVVNFSTYNFYLPAGTSAGDTVLHLTTSDDTDMTGSTVNIKANGQLNLRNADKIYLVQKDGGSLYTDGMQQNVDVFVGVTANLTGTVSQEDNNLVFTAKTASANGSVTINPDTKSAVETRAAQSNVVNMGSDYFVNTTMAQVASLAYGADGFGAFGGSSGSAHMRYETGSHVDARGTAFNAGIAKKNANHLARSHGARSLRRGMETMTAISTTARTAAARRAARAAACSRVRNLRAGATWKEPSASARRRRTTPRPTSARATARMRRTSAHTSASAE